MQPVREGFWVGMEALMLNEPVFWAAALLKSTRRGRSAERMAAYMVDVPAVNAWGLKSEEEVIRDNLLGGSSRTSYRWKTLPLSS